MIPTSLKASQFTESVIREMTRVFLARGDRPGVNLAQGFPDFAAPEEMKRAAMNAIARDVNQYAITWGSVALRQAISDHTARFYGIQPDPEREITVCCGATEAMIAALLAVANPGDEVIVFEPFYENYGPDAVLSGALPRFVRLRPPDWSFDEAELRAAFSDRTRAIIVNTPNNPTGKVFTRDELGIIGELCSHYGAVAITDEIYEHIVYEGSHVPMMTLPGMRERSITISGLSKTFSATGWRIGWIIAPPEATSAIRKVHDFLTVGAPAPLQEGAAVALQFPDDYYRGLATQYRERRDFLLPVLREVGFTLEYPAGAYYVLAGIESFGTMGDQEFAMWLVDHVGIATVPGSSFFTDPAAGRRCVRFAFCKKMQTLSQAAELLRGLAAAPG